MKSRLAEQARQERLQQERHLTPEQRLVAFLHHSRLVTQLFLAGRATANPQTLNLELPRGVALRFGRHTALTLDALLT
jgi:hypothetical protein